MPEQKNGMVMARKVTVGILSTVGGALILAMIFANVNHILDHNLHEEPVARDQRMRLAITEALQNYRDNRARNDASTQNELRRLGEKVAVMESRLQDVQRSLEELKNR